MFWENLNLPMSGRVLLFAIFAFVVTTAAAFQASAQQNNNNNNTDSDFAKSLQPFFEQHCYECHDDLTAKGDLDLFALESDVSNPINFVTWMNIYDRVEAGEMPPKENDRPEAKQLTAFLGTVEKPLMAVHAAQKGTVLRRLNRLEYQNTINDLFGTNLDLAANLPEDARSHEFDNVGEALSISMVQMQRYLESARTVLDTAIASKTKPPETKTIRASYADMQGADKFIGSSWHKLPDGAIVFFRRISYPSGMLREANVRTPGRYKVRVTGYAHQSEKPITFSVGATTFKRGAEKPTFGYFSFKPGKAQTVEIDTWIDENYMIETTPYGIYDPDNLIKQNGIDKYKGPGLAIQHIEVEGPIIDEFPSKGHRFVFQDLIRTEIEPRNPADKEKKYYQPKFQIVTQNPVADATAALQGVASRAFRRPASLEKVAPYVDLFQTELASGSTFEEAYRTAVTAIFCAPDFLYLREKPGWLDDFALASRLSYFLTRSAPDDELLAAASAGKLRTDPQALFAQVERLMKHEHFERFIVDFTDAWLNLRDIEFTNPDKTLFPEFDPFLQYSMLRESRSFLRELIDKNMSVANVVKSDFAMLNSRLADHYEIDGVKGADLQRVSLPADSVRGGFMAQGSVLKVSANGNNTSPVVRGVWLMERILGEIPPPPPAAVPGVEPDIRGATTLRELLVKHREAKNCRSCHELIDPPGFAMEGFNPVGGWRERYRALGGNVKKEDKLDKIVHGRKVRYHMGLEVDDSGTLDDGRGFAGYREFRDHLANDPDTLAKALASKLLTFATGREMGFSDRPEIERIVKKAGEKGYGIRDLMINVVTSEIFRKK